MNRSDFIVVGAGIAGASVAYELAAQATVTLLEAEPAPGMHATGRSAALYSETYGNATIRALSRASRPFLQAPPPGFAEVPLLRDRGVLYVATEAQKEALRAQHVQEEAGRLIAIDPAAAFDRVPILRRDRWSHFLLEPDARDIDVDAVFQGFLRGAKRRGAVLLTEHAVHGIRRREGKWIVTTSAAEFAAPVLIDAAGAWADELAGMAGIAPIGIVPKRRTALLVDAPAGQAIERWPLVVDVEESFYFKPDAGRLLVSPADETPMAPCDAQPDDLDVAVAVDRLEHATTLNVQKVVSSWAGLRTFVADRAPVCGFESEAPDWFWLAAQGGYGIQTAPALARLAAALVRGEGPPEDLTNAGVDPLRLSPERLRAVT